MPLKTLAASFINYGVSFNSKRTEITSHARAQNIPASNCFQARKQIFEINLVHGAYLFPGRCLTPCNFNSQISPLNRSSFARGGGEEKRSAGGNFRRLIKFLVHNTLSSTHRGRIMGNEQKANAHLFISVLDG